MPERCFAGVRGTPLLRYRLPAGVSAQALQPIYNVKPLGTCLLPFGWGARGLEGGWRLSAERRAAARVQRDAARPRALDVDLCGEWGGRERGRRWEQWLKRRRR